MTLSPQTHFTNLNEAEKRSKLWQLASQKGECTIWHKGQKNRYRFRVKEYKREEKELIIHQEPASFPTGSELLGTFDLNGVDYFFKAKILKNSPEEIKLDLSGEFYKSERRKNFRLLAYPIYDINASFTLPDDYEGGKVIDIKKRASQTGLFKSFLRIVETEDKEKFGNILKLRVQDLSVTGLSIYIGEIELSYFKTGDLISGLEIDVVGEKFIIPQSRVVYVVDQIGHHEAHIKKFKVGIQFENPTQELDEKLAKRINELLRQFDANNEFEDFVK